MDYPSKAEMKNALLERVGDKRKKQFESVRVAICGLGGLGSNIAIALARAGVENLVLIDFDRVDIGNINRQQYKAGQIGKYKTEALSDNLKEILSYIEPEAHCVRLEEGNYSLYLSSADIICEAFDSAEEKSRLVNFVLENMPDKVIVSGSGMAGLGSPNEIKTKRITEKFYVCGDGVSDTEKGEVLYAPRVMLCAAHQALTVLRILAEM